MWYKRDEQPRRIGFWYTGVGTAVMAGSLVSFGFQHYTGDRFNNWQIMYLVVGLITIAAGIVVILFLPDNPMTSRLSHPEKVLAVSRLRENNTGIENKTFKPYQFREAMTDPQVWLLAFITTAASIPNGAVSSFQSVIISGFGFTNKQTALIQIPGGLITVASTLLGTYIAGRYNCRGLMLATWAALGGILGGGMIAFLPASSRAGRLAGNYLTNMTGSFLPLAYAFAACNFAVSFAHLSPPRAGGRRTYILTCAQGHTKKITLNAILLMSFCLGNILGPLTFRNADAPDYVPAKITIVAVESVVLCAVAVLLLYYRVQNRKRDREASGEHVVGAEFGDLTDRENKELRYKY